MQMLPALGGAHQLASNLSLAAPSIHSVFSRLASRNVSGTRAHRATGLGVLVCACSPTPSFLMGRPQGREVGTEPGCGHWYLSVWPP